MNTECSKGEADVEIINSSNVLLFGMKAEGNAVKLWVRRSTDVLYTGFGDFGTPLPITAPYPSAFAQYTPSLIRLEESDNITLANLWGDCRIGPSISGFGSFCYSPAVWSMVLWQQGAGAGNSGARVLPPLVRPVLFEL